jgi:hypothetical protein
MPPTLKIPEIRDVVQLNTAKQLAPHRGAFCLGKSVDALVRSLPVSSTGVEGTAHQEKSLFNSSVRASFPARLADAVVSK